MTTTNSPTWHASATTPRRPPVRVRPCEVLPELSGQFACDACGKLLTTADRNVSMIHMDAVRTEKGDVKARTFIGCSPSCTEHLEESATVQHGLVGVVEQRSTRDDAQ